MFPVRRLLVQAVRLLPRQTATSTSRLRLTPTAGLVEGTDGLGVVPRVTISALQPGTPLSRPLSSSASAAAAAHEEDEELPTNTDADAHPEASAHDGAPSYTMPPGPGSESASGETMAQEDAETTNSDADAHSDESAARG